MKIIFRLLLAAGFIALSAWLWTILFPSPDKAIRHRLDEIARTASFIADESPLLIAGKAQKMAGYMSTNIEVTLDVAGEVPHKLSGRDEIQQAAAGAHMATRSLVVQFLDPEVVVGADKQSATVNLTVKAQPDGQKDFIVQQMRFTFRKMNGEWLVTRIETVRALS
ncbi:MAG TPA: hypothetical protein VN625_00870 [Desulfuromonadaceae bacterium]|nr:hypothetical protein [Desulfuromonadaceae bacterium]